jgi:hypothetical protein
MLKGHYGITATLEVSQGLQRDREGFDGPLAGLIEVCRDVRMMETNPAAVIPGMKGYQWPNRRRPGGQSTEHDPKLSGQRTGKLNHG